MIYFSIITATYNAEAVLPRLLESLAAQTCRGFEVIIQDGASTDSTVAIAESWRGKLPQITIHSTHDSGIYDAWNKAIKVIQGEWVLFLGADDRLYDKNVLSKTFDIINANCSFSENNNIDFVAGGIAISTKTGFITQFITGMTQTAVENLHGGGIPTPFPGLFIRRSLLTRNAFNDKLKIAGDYDFLCRTWFNNNMGMRLPFFVTIMCNGGISTLPQNASLSFKENADIAKKYFGVKWTYEQHFHYCNSLVVSFLYKHIPHKYALSIHSHIRKIFGKSPQYNSFNTKMLLQIKAPSFSPELTPIFIVSYNRLQYLKELIKWLEKHNYTNIFIVDNNSTYIPLLEYLDTLPYNVTRLSENLGHLVVWKCGLFSKILDNQFYIVTDPDVVPTLDCPDDLIPMLYNQLIAFPKITKCGPSLLIDDIPDYFPLRDIVLQMETKFWRKHTPNNKGFFAHIDTTFALYRPTIKPDDEAWFEGVRLAPPYSAHHLPWYENPSTLTEEMLYYQTQTIPQSSFWSVHDTATLKNENIMLREQLTVLRTQIEFLTQSFPNRISLLFFKVLRHIKHKLLGK